ncbi:interleukin-17 receptor E isoform X5 [Octodon degus]|uniref:Interleukin-17 receptor E isoform X5 n=1 Tax=Octodon degus TaxID=10160 RepID=A0A6P6DNV4_OCTDE|nr:interleukin-17 receptor E isoform X5 [Octodon degus]
MGSSRLAALLLAVFLLPTGLSPSADTGCGCLSHRITRCLLAFHMNERFTGLEWGWFRLLMQRYKKSYKFKFCQGHRMPASPQRKLLDSRVQSEKGLPISTPTLNVSRKRLRYRRTQPSDPGAVGSLRRGGPEFTFELLPVAQAIRVTIPLGPEVSVRLCHQWALECEELSSPFDAQKTVAGGHTEDLSYEFLLPCLCIEAAYLQKDTVRSKKCPFQNWPEAEAYAPNLWKSVHFTDHSQHNRMVMALTLHCPLKLEASLCQRQDQHSLCEDLPNATVQESEGWYVWEKVDLHPLLCFKFYFENSSHVECPHQSGSLPSWNVSAATQAQQLILHFSSRTSASFSATWSYPGLELDTAMSPVYSISQAQGPDPVTVDLIIPFLRPGGCILGSVPSGVENRRPVCQEAPPVSQCLSQTPRALDPRAAGPLYLPGRCSGPHLSAAAAAVRPGSILRPRRRAASAAPARRRLGGAAAPGGSAGRAAAGRAGRRARRDRGPVGGHARGAGGPASLALGCAGARGPGTRHRAAAVEPCGPQPDQ